MEKRYLLIEIEKSNFMYEGNGLSHRDYITNIRDYQNYDVLILTAIMEEYPEQSIYEISKSIEILKEEYPHLEIVVFMGSQYLRKAYRHANNNAHIEHDNVYYVNPFWYCLYYTCVKNPVCKTAPEYKLNAPKDFLYLIGKPDREHRLEILYRLYKKDLLKNANWKFVVHNDYVKENCRTLINHLTNKEFEDFISKTQNTLDDVPIEYSTDSSHFPGIPFDYTIFEDSKFQVIAETDFGSNIISEKTYLSILNKRPFIMAAQLGHNHQLNQYGFKTFEEYCLHQDYQTEETNNDERYNKIIDNIEHWIYNIDNFYNEIKSDVEHNYNLFKQLGKQEEEKIKQILVKHNINAEPNDIIKGYYID